MSLNEFKFNEFYINDLLDKLSKENEMVFIIGDFNTNLLDYIQGTSSNEYIDSLSSQLFLPYVLHPTKERYDSKTIVDYVFLNTVSSYIIIGNLTSSVSDHLLQFLIAPNIFSNPQAQNLTYIRETEHYLTNET